MQQSTATVLLVCLLATIQTSWGLKCYNCQGSKECNEGDLSKLQASDCVDTGAIDSVTKFSQFIPGGEDIKQSVDDLKKTSCSKVVLETGGALQIFRQCAFGTEEFICEGAKKLARTAQTKLSSCNICESDLCNAGHTFHAAAGLVLASFAIFTARYL